MASGYNTFVILCIIIILRKDSLGQTPSQEQHGANKTFELFIKGQKNQTGHWITQFQMSEESLQAQNNWKMNLKHSTYQHGEVHSFHITGALIVPPPLPHYYELFPGVGYYKFHYRSKVTFQEASSTCAKEGGHLAIINSQKESEVIKTIYARNGEAGGPWSYIGFIDPNKTQDFVTIYGQPIIATGFSTWHKEEPNNWKGNEYCGCVIRESGLLGDVNCEEKLSFFCEYDLAWTDL